MKTKIILIIACCSSLCCNTKKESGGTDLKKVDKTDSVIPKPLTYLEYVQVDISPMDMSYFPVDYPKLKMAKSTTEGPKARVVYSRPHLQGRKLFHALLKYGEPWRLGANESTELDLYADAMIQDKKIKAGRYVLYCVPAHEKWTIVLNSNIDCWGLEPDPSKDIARFTIPITETGNTVEYFTMLFQKTTTGADLFMAWDNVEARLPFSF